MPSTSPTEIRRSRLDVLLPGRPSRRRPALPPLELLDGGRFQRPAFASVADRLFDGRRSVLAALGGGALDRPARPEPFPRRDPLLVLVQRITQGFQRDEIERARGLGYEAYLEEQLDHLALDDSEMEARMAGLTTLERSPRELFDAHGEDFTEPYLQFKSAPLLRSVHSKRQLFERMCEFWNDHFSIDQDKGDIEWALLPEHDRLTIRPNALGSFPELLSSVAHGGAMLFYLDNWLNLRVAPQENWARELLELHTLGVRGGYTESDVKEVAKCFTGWTLNQNLRPSFFRLHHQPGAKVVLGHVIGNDPPRADAQRVLEILATHPGTARFLAHKLIHRFLTPVPPLALVERVAAIHVATNGDIKAMLREILARENMRVPAMAAPKFRRPFHFVVSLLRALDAEVSDALYPLAFLYTMGHVPFGHVQPDGYPDSAEAWGTSLLGRWRFASELLHSAATDGFPWPGVALSRTAIAQKLEFDGPSDRFGLARRINERILGSALPEREHDLLQEFIDERPGPFGINALLEAIALGASFPGFQWY